MSTTTTNAAASGVRYIYGLADADGRIRYVGRTANVQGRLVMHQRMARYTTRTGPVYVWLRELEQSPTVVVLQAVAADDASRAEVEWILRFRAIADPAAPLLNVRPGLPTAARGRPKSPEHRAAIATGVKRYYDGNPRLPVTCPDCGRVFHGEKGLTSHRTRLTAPAACRRMDAARLDVAA